MPCTVVTFYSYKGGVGRSFALANIAVILAQWGCRVLAVDWDIEAPGLNHYFASFSKELPAGVMDFLQDCSQGEPRSWDTYVGDVDIPQASGQLQFMPAAQGGGTDYGRLVQGLNWDELYHRHALGSHLERLRSSWTQQYDMVLIDSRTGLTDFSGLTTAQLPDVLAFMFTANEQSLAGCASIARRSMEARRQMPIDRPALLPLPIPARFEQREEYDRAQKWRERFVTDLRPFVENWAPLNTDHHKIIDSLTIPYVPRWTFGEEIAAILEPPGSSGTRTTGQAASYACETIAAVLVQGFAKIELLSSSRDEYVHTARSVAQSLHSSSDDLIRVFISYPKKEMSLARRISRDVMEGLELRRGRKAAVLMDETSPAGADWSAWIQRELETADGMIALIDDSFSPSSIQTLEMEMFLRQSLRSAQSRTIIPVVLEGGERAFHSSKFADYSAVFLNTKEPVERQLEPVISRLSRLRE